MTMLWKYKTSHVIIIETAEKQTNSFGFDVIEIVSLSSSNLSLFGWTNLHKFQVVRGGILALLWTGITHHTIVSSVNA